MCCCCCCCCSRSSPIGSAHDSFVLVVPVSACYFHSFVRGRDETGGQHGQGSTSKWLLTNEVLFTLLAWRSQVLCLDIIIVICGLLLFSVCCGFHNSHHRCNINTYYVNAANVVYTYFHTTFNQLHHNEEVIDMCRHYNEQDSCIILPQPPSPPPPSGYTRSYLLIHSSIFNDTTRISI